MTKIDYNKTIITQANQVPYCYFSKPELKMMFRAPAYRTPAKKFAYVDTTIVKCRLHGIYKQYINQNFDRMVETVSDTIAVMKYTPNIEMDTATYKSVMNALERTRIDFAVKNYKDGHRRLRELYYTLEQ